MATQKFAFIIHPLNVRDVARKYPFTRYLPERLVEWGLKFKEPMAISHITGVHSTTGEEAEGWFIGCPLTPRQLAARAGRMGIRQTGRGARYPRGSWRCRAAPIWWGAFWVTDTA